MNTCLTRGHVNNHPCEDGDNCEVFKGTTCSLSEAHIIVYDPIHDKYDNSCRLSNCQVLRHYKKHRKAEFHFFEPLVKPDVKENDGEQFSLELKNILTTGLF
jgi:hypothetical protein